MTAIKKLNKKAIFGASLILSAILGFFFSTSKRYESNILSLIADVPLSGIERVRASGDSGGGAGCTGSSDSYDPAVYPSAIAISLKQYTGSEGGVHFGDGGCFVAGTTVLLEDNSEKRIEDIVSGDRVVTSGGIEDVSKYFHIPFEGDIFAFNGSENFFVTATHPFMTTAGWKSLDPEGTRKETPGLDVTLLATGDTLILRDGTMLVHTINSKPITTTVYNLTVNGSHDFYANGFLVHNVGRDFSRRFMVVSRDLK